MPKFLPQRRQFPRIPSQNAVLIRALGPQSVEELSRTKTLGLGGCGLLSDESFGVGSLVEVLISVERRVVKARAEVVYEKPSFGRFDLGLKFRGLDNDDFATLRRLLEVEPEANG